MTDSGDDKPNQRSLMAPDFSHEALAHLQIQSDTFALHVENYLNVSADSNRETLKEDIQRFRNTLVLLEKGAAVYVAEELLSLLDADAAGDIENRSELGRVLITAADQLSDHVAQLQRDGSLENALSLLPLVNDSRALREEALLSDVLVLAAGIQIPDSMPASVSDEQWQEQRVEWVEYATEQHPRLAAKLLEWFQGDDLEKALDLSPQLRLLTEFCRSRDYLDILVPLYQSASIVAEALAKEEIVDGPALRKIFAQLERHMHRCILVASPEDLLPGDLLRNFLYYVGQVESTSQVAIELRRRFRLDRVKQSTNVVHHSTPTIGIGYHLAKAIRESIGTETQVLRDWLNQAPTRIDRPDVVRLKVRLAQLEPVLTLMGIPDALNCLQQINKDLSSLDGQTSIDSETRIRLAESLLLLDAILDKSARNSITGTGPGTGNNAQSTVTAEDVFIDSATDACLREARLGLQQVAETLETLLKMGVLPTGRCHALNQQIQLVDSSLQILPLPEISPLLQGLIEVLACLQLSGREGCSDANRDASVQQEVATMLVSLDYYLGCVLQPQAAASELLLDAEESLHRALEYLNGETINPPLKLTEKEWEANISLLLPHMDSLGVAIASYRRDSSVAVYQGIAHALQQFEYSTHDQTGSSIHLLAVAAKNWFSDNTSGSETLGFNELCTLDEIHAVLPQLFDQMLSGSDSVRGFDELIQRLQRSPSYPAEHEHYVEARELTLNVDESLLSNELDESETSGFDQTLRHVFYHECLSHLEALDESVRLAVDAGDDVSRRLPSEQMLRALHTLTGSAQTVDAPHIVAIVQPLQRVALTRQRVGNYFDEAETSFVGDLVVALRARLESLGSDGNVSQSVISIENRLVSFLAASIPGAQFTDTKDAIVSRGRSLDDVFDEEADELVERLRLIVNGEQHDLQNTYDALAVLHTLKGSARMAGRTTIAEHAHTLESEIQELQNTDAQAFALHTGYSVLSQLLTQAGVQPRCSDVVPAEPAVRVGNAYADSSMVSDTAFDTLLDLATDVTVNQARLSDELARLREVYQDIENISSRFRELPQSTAVKSTTEVNEILADLEATRSVMRQALRQAEREQQQASRASAGLQQNLIRTRLVRVDELFDRLSQTVLDTAQSTGRIARLRIEGGEVTLDRSLYRQLLAPLQHLARNAVVHGIETPEERAHSGKAPSGDLLLSATVDGTDLVLRFSDDGRGIERHTLSAKLKEKGETALNSHAELQQILFQSGFSTVETPSALAGHGLGLAAVKSAVEYLGGRIQLATESGSGTRLTLRLPQRIVVNQVVLVESEGVLFALPVNFVDAVRVAAGSPGSIPERYRRTSLSALVSQSPTRYGASQKQQRSAILVTASGVSVALEIEKVIGYRELVTQALGPQLASLQRYSGGSVLSDGRQVLILDLPRILENVGAEVFKGVKPARESLRPVALIVDDSLTMRVAAESILEQCGIATRLTRDGVEALDSMASALPNLILLDLEMPRLDGKAFLKRAKKEYGDACPPVIVISSRDHPENREQLMKMGATRFLTKPYTQIQLQEALEAAGLRLPDITIA
ncbi:MAG: chemotaxis protein histidine kinase CheA/ActR/RegA family two-component response regulator [bacterium]|jgi:chemotaxis protein histidine kinase CheA/ActR/RegA family two-component response regulator